ncbi:N-acetyl-gamma-glutamyl-phosphate reductase [Metabacillus niabensis]|uniref:N-acetyl-gamma-glutamyl-phosphate reductase n=1 Tax=Metabacillus niabensis TaxID=324854 RepID=A0ABT9Z1G9_9BACI|nr:N-acetyl-gamma-glutamyl-phosphate reductase [Metabacillus niabensis]MDQ0226052.1 N-acetyl-gamma-glutamyl-phosphate reductase [Metabacillus niabensis]
MYKIFIDGQEGTTGLKIHDFLANRNDLEILKIDSVDRKNSEKRRILLNEADIVFLCLPDSISKEAVSMIENNKTRVIDASTAFRTNKNWVYGLPELNREQRELIVHSNRVSVPGCHATGFIIGLYPLIKNQIIPKEYPITCQSITGYSGGGKNLIQTYKTGSLQAINSPKHYSLIFSHKHLPEMQHTTGLAYPPIFSPIVGNFYKGMVTSIPLTTRLLKKRVTAKEICEVLSDYYKDEKYIHIIPYNDESYLENGFFNAEECNHTNRTDEFVFGHEEQIMIMTRLDNLGKGSAGAAIQNMNIMLGLDEATGLTA